MKYALGLFTTATAVAVRCATAFAPIGKNVHNRARPTFVQPRLWSTQIDLTPRSGGPKPKPKLSTMQKSTSTDISQRQQHRQENGIDVTKLLLQYDNDDDSLQNQDLDFKAVILAGVGALLVASAVAVSSTGLVLPPLQDVIPAIQNFMHDPTPTLEMVVSKIDAMGPMGVVYFGLLYTLAEVLAIPAFPLTASAGYLFGVVAGTSVVIVSASIAAAFSFMIGRTILRSYVEGLLEDYPEFKKIDKAIGIEGFKLMLLLRMSPVFPFALSNYLYGASSVGFWPYFLGTMIGFTPGTIAYVYSGEFGKVLTLGSADAQPWYVHVGGIVVLSGFLKLLADAATGIIEGIDEDDE